MVGEELLEAYRPEIEAIVSRYKSQGWSMTTCGKRRVWLCGRHILVLIIQRTLGAL